MPFPEMVNTEEEAGFLLPKSSPGPLLASLVGVLVMFVLSKMENPNFHANGLSIGSHEMFLD